MIKAGILGATGYAGQELMRLLHGHDGVKITKLISQSYTDKKYSYVYRNFTGFSSEVCSEADYSVLVDGIDVLFCALPYGVLMEKLTADILEQVTVIDLGVDYRCADAEEFRGLYGKQHMSIELASQFTYGLCEWNRQAIESAEHIANPGCFATAIELALLPLVKENIIGSSVIIDGKLALSGSGRELTIGTHFTEANESVKAYKPINHPHTFEAQRAIKQFAGKAVNITFVPHIIPMQRGAFVSCYADLAADADEGFIRGVYGEYYENKRFVQVLDKGMYVETKWVRNSNMCHINFELDKRNNRLMVFAAIDNLVKGAAGQAIQNLNIMKGFREDCGIDFVPACL